MSQASGAIHSIRSSITEVDRAILSLLAARMRLVSLVGEAKVAQGMPVYDPSREVEVLSIVREEAAKRGLPPDLASEIYSIIMSYSRCAQVTCPERLRIAFYGYGDMARTLARHAARGGCWVAITGRNPKKAEEAAQTTGVEYMSVEEALDWADILIYAVPWDVVPELLREHAKIIRESMLVADIASVKKPLVERVSKLLPDGVEYVSLHPLFGPVECPAGETVVVVPIRLDSWRHRLEALLEGLGFRYEYVDADTHDRVMAANQVLHHAVLEAFRRAYQELLRELNVTPGLAKLLVTRSLRQTLSVVERIESLEKVVQEIRKGNPYADKALEALRRALQDLHG
ncbi:Chorismate mutase, type II [Pyrolobus fumarii 1A]|uniref:Chorismate mutase, type II n=1 Tax=Pyrolobus fumarii (strain DSM 11204 / 1A) TaxID=694429 RepID=G0EHA6_PYRF1|nr:bifunctional chorismate mutase/prephenate dehydrogenase [Pyrolobus fumarii]AEM39330.1 Chorismate mutase, type II [Pyrolobus fumarii 1A]